MQSFCERNNVHLQGCGNRPLLFLHGFGCDQRMWRLVAPRFEEAYRVVLMDYVGAGASDFYSWNPERYGSLQGYASDVVEVMDELDLHDVTLVGHSVSSMIGLLAAIQRPERTANLVMVCPSPRYLNDLPQYFGGFERADLEGLIDLMDRNFIGWANFLAPLIMNNPDRPELALELELSFCSTDPVIGKCFAIATFFSDSRLDLPKCPVPSLILQCREDSVAPECVGEYVHQNTPQSTLVRLQATGHCPHMSHPDETYAAMAQYLSGQEGRTHADAESAA